ncbi:Hsp33 family molecular chaperone HslO [Altererythrobacter indicus]|uniref:Hsp33 family molecular chaperone HslO n=1 Tax=Altericroceibacterium indicum TaxID=374177 RepID=A0A845ABI5_9SPHN|nr:Hsp33 family molecular chaperone HslO [Altericroceibacterium indicum]MXP26867.1 Hsp33 family molecular chaperone HslO [Altericroceibacterium indicum]
MTDNPIPMTPPADETGFDQILAFSLPERDARGRAVRLGPVLDTILAAHDYPPALKHLLGEALVLTALMGGLLKDEGSQLTLQAQTKGGVVDLLVCDYRDNELRGYVKHDRERFDGLGANPTLAALFGEGYLAITYDLATSGQRYQGVVPLEGGSLSEAVQAYFAQSEQVPTIIQTAVKAGPDGCVAGGLLVQHLPEGEEGRERLHVRMDHPEWEHVSILTSTIRHDELVDPALSQEAMVWRLFHEESEVRVEAGPQLRRGCRCTVEHFENVISRFSKDERREMSDDQGIIRVDCAFCSREFPIQD